MSETGALLRRARTDAGLTQTELARRIGVTQPMVAAWESGAREPSVATFRRLVRALGLRLELAPRPGVTFPDPVRAGRVFAELLDWLDRVPADGRPRAPLEFPAPGRR